MFGNNDLSPQWIKEAYKKEYNRKQKLANAYNSLKNHETSHAEGIWRTYKMRCEILDVIAKYARNEDK